MPGRRYEDFIRENLALAPVPGVPEISLHTAHPASRLGRIALDAPYFAYAWAGGIALARFLLDNPGLVAGRRVLDLGAGSGLVGIAAARVGAAVTAAETDPAGVAAIALNAQANGVRIEVVPHDLLDAPLLPVDLVLAGDVFYAPGVALRMLAFLDRSNAAGIDVLVGDPGRTDLPVARLRRIAAFTVADVASAAMPAGIYAIAGSRLAGSELAR
ncbi:MAG: methyltransferase [Rhizobiaceae bacterium]|nr:methyltransferase [Rhizobiaceae bacterium]